MPKLIKQIHDIVDLAFDQGLTHHWSREQIDVAIHKAQMKLFRELVGQHPRTLRARNLLLPFQKTEIIVLTSGIGAIPQDFEHDIEFFVNDSGKRHVPCIERGFWDTRKRDPIDTPSATNPICTVYGDTNGAPVVEVEPTSLTTIGVLRFIEPPKPGYAVKEEDGFLVYDDDSSTDVAWHASVHDIIAEAALDVLGIALKDVQAIQVAMNTMNTDQKL